MDAATMTAAETAALELITNIAAADKAAHNCPVDVIARLFRSARDVPGLYRAIKMLGAVRCDAAYIAVYPEAGEVMHRGLP